MDRVVGALALVAVVAVAACGPAGPSGSAPPLLPIVVTRTGGIAGVHDEVEIAADGTATATASRFGPTGPCVADQAAVVRLRAFDLAAVGAAPQGRPIADGFNYRVTIGTATASAGDGDEGLRRDFAAAAATVLESCFESVSEPGATE